MLCLLYICYSAFVITLRRAYYARYYVSHLAFAEEIYRHLESPVNDVEFFAGNLIPDLVPDKKASHFRMPASVQGFEVPDMNEVKKNLYDKSNSITLGMYCHLYLDYHFIESYLIPEFIWNVDKMEVINPRNGNVWSVKQFFAKPANGGILYNSYTQINKLLLSEKHIKMETVETLPDILPPTNIPLFDTRREKTWREELNGYLSEDAPYTGEALDYHRLWNSISTIAEKFVNEEI